MALQGWRTFDLTRDRRPRLHPFLALGFPRLWERSAFLGSRGPRSRLTLTFCVRWYMHPVLHLLGAFPSLDLDL